MENSLFGYSPIPSVAFSNEEAIKNIMSLYNIDRFDLDCTYSIGAFYKNLPKPKTKSDINPQKDDVIQARSEELPFEDFSFNTVMFDPPFVVGGRLGQNKGSNITAKRFGTFDSFDDLKRMYFNSLQEIYRVLNLNGILCFKCQDVVNDHRNYFSHSLIMNMALYIGFYPKDLIVLIAANRITGGKWVNQEHARKHHSYFWIFVKTKCKIDYSF